MARIDTDQGTILESIKARLIASLGLHESHVLEVVEPLQPPDILPSGDNWVSIAMGGSTFPFEEQGIPQVREDFEVHVTGYTKISLDQQGDDAAFLHKDATRSILLLKRKILIALAGWDLETDDIPAEKFLASLLYAKSATAPTYDASKLIGWVMITFGVEFDWDMTI